MDQVTESGRLPVPGVLTVRVPRLRAHGDHTQAPRHAAQQTVGILCGPSALYTLYSACLLYYFRDSSLLVSLFSVNL